MIKKWLSNYVNLWKLNTNAKTFRKNEINSIILTFNKFITNAHKKEKKLRSRNQNILVNTNLNVKCCLNVEKWVWVLIQCSNWENWESFAFFKRRRDCEQRFDIWSFFCNNENVCEINFRIQMIVDNDDKYERNIWNRWKMMHFEMRN